jgi:hypothetical protein
MNVHVYITEPADALLNLYYLETDCMNQAERLN